MRLQHYITEAGEKEVHLEEVEDLYDLLKKDCAQYLKLLKGRKPLFRGIDTVRDFEVGIKSVRKDRHTRLMSNKMVEFIDKHLKSRNLPLRRESMMCTPDENRINMFGNQRCFVYPIGNFKFAMVRSSDMNFTNTNHTWNPDELNGRIGDWLKYYGGEKTEEGREEKSDIYDYLIQSISGNSQKAFDEAYKNNYEMWFDCKKYYYVDISGDFSIIYNMF